jgi:phosphoribosylformylglycinamidine synthase
MKRSQSKMHFKKALITLQDLIKERKIKGSWYWSGGLITTLLEMCFADVNLGANFDLTAINEIDSTKLLFSENIALFSKRMQKWKLF